MWMSVFLSAHHVHAWCPMESKGTESPVTGCTDRMWAVIWVLGIEPGLLEEQPVFLLAEPYLQHHKLYIL